MSGDTTTAAIISDARVFSDKIARHPELLGVRGAIKPEEGARACHHSVSCGGSRSGRPRGRAAGRKRLRTGIPGAAGAGYSGALVLQAGLGRDTRPGCRPTGGPARPPEARQLEVAAASEPPERKQEDLPQPRRLAILARGPQVSALPRSEPPVEALVGS